MDLNLCSLDIQVNELHYDVFPQVYLYTIKSNKMYEIIMYNLYNSMIYNFLFILIYFYDSDIILVNHMFIIFY